MVKFAQNKARNGSHFRCRGPFHKGFFARNSNPMQISTVIQKLVVTLQQLFAHTTTEQLSWHVQNFEAIPL